MISNAGYVSNNKIVAIACSTGGPRALQTLIPALPSNLASPVLIVQHMPEKFTASLAARLDELSPLHVQEAEAGDTMTTGNVYIARGGVHMNVRKVAGKHLIHFSDEPPREGVKPCANYMYESLATSGYSEIVCVVLTGMGADGTKGISMLMNYKRISVIAQNEETCAVYGMPRSIVRAELAIDTYPLEQIANEIIKTKICIIG